MLLLGITNLNAAEYQFAKKSQGEKEVHANEQAMAGICSRALTIDLPQSGEPIHIWLRAIGWGMELNSYKANKQTQHEWVKFNSPTKWGWKKVQTYDAGSQDKVIIVVPKVFNDKNELIAALDCVVMTQDKDMDIQAVETEILHKLTSPPDTPQILPLPDGDTFPINLETVANISLNPVDGKQRVFSPDTKRDTRLNLQGMELFLAEKKNLFVGVWKPVSDEKLKERDVSVAQADDKIREGVILPQESAIPVGDTFTALSFLHTIKGAGEFGDVLFNYVITYDDGNTVIIPIKEGERIGGQLKPTEIALGHEVYNNLVDYRSLSLFISTWKNPYPQSKIITVTLQAVAPKVIPITLGIAGHRALLNGQTSSQSQSHQVTVSVDFAQTIRPVRDGLFGINVPYVSKAKDDRYFEEFRDVDFATLRIGNHCPPVEGRSQPTPEELAKQDAYFQKLADGTHTRMLLNIKSLGKYPQEEDKLQQYIADRVSWNMAVLKHLIDEKQFPIAYIEVFNEELIGHKDAPLKYRYYNALASRIKSQYPHVKVGGTAECWPDTGVLEQFIIHCGENMDLLTWHMYATGKASTPTTRIMQATDRLAKSSQQLQDIYNKHFPGRKLEQSITEYNINYASWRPPYEERQGIGTGCVWTMSVLKHLLYDGDADSAMYWHYYTGGNYGVVTSDYQRRPARTLFYLLNRYLRAAQLCKVQSDHDMIEVLAAQNKTCYVSIILNKSSQPLSITPRITGMEPTGRIDMATSYDIAGTDTAFTPNRIVMDQPYELAGYGMRFVVIPR